MNLIANTGIQLYTNTFELPANEPFKMFFHEWLDVANKEYMLEIAHYFSDSDLWVRKNDLYYLGYVQSKLEIVNSHQLKRGMIKSSWEDIQDDFFANNKKIIPINSETPEEDGCFAVSMTKLNWSKYENVWLPMPFFLLKRKTQFGPTNWCRFKLIPLHKGSEPKKYQIIIAFDTKADYFDGDNVDEDLMETPIFTNDFDKEKNYALCNDEILMLDFLSKSKHCEWVDEQLLKTYHNVSRLEDLKIKKPKLKYLADYICLLNYIEKLDILPTVTLLADKHVGFKNVDLVVDIGNSRTCAVLFEEGNFKQMSPLELQDFTTIFKDAKLNKYTDSFDMRLALREVDFGGDFIKSSRQFIFPSFVRLGNEAKGLIQTAVNQNTGDDKVSTFSSPKRYLWDNAPQHKEWEYVSLTKEDKKPIWIKGISEYLNEDGSLNSDGTGSAVSCYSRKSLMTFSFLEIVAQAFMQINSYEQRVHWGDVNMARKIGRVIVTCPTAMSRVEQVALRKCAEEAVILIERFYNLAGTEQLLDKKLQTKTRIIPASFNVRNAEELGEWIYDEATCAQFVFLYAEIGKRYLKNVKDYFDFYGKITKDNNGVVEPTLTIGSVDIGAGTTDLMIAQYKYDGTKACTLKPLPLFWESFYKAGDDLVKELVQQLVVEGQFSPITQKLKTLGKTEKEIVELNNDFFGGDTGMPSLHRQRRANFNLQVSVPIVTYMLEILKDYSVESKVLTFNSVFSNNMPSDIVLKQFKLHFGFELENIQWYYERKVMTSIVEKTFDTLVGKISAILSTYKCDIVLISGRPTSLKPLSDLFLKYYAISPNRLKTMNDYRVGRWYPEDKRYKFLDGNGRFNNPKSIITTGAMIGYKASVGGGIDGFVLDLSALVKNMKPTTECFGLMNEFTMQYENTIISKENNTATFSVSISKNNPVRIACRQIDSESYPSRPFYVLGFNQYNIEDRVRGRLPENVDMHTVQSAITNELESMVKKCPYTVTIERDYEDDKECLKLETILDKDGNDLNKRFINLQVQSMSETKDYWLDSGIFSLNINDKNK